MGFFETIMGAGIIPGIIVVLVLLASGAVTSSINKLIISIIGIELKVAGWSFKLINLMILTNLCYIFACLAKISRMNTLHA